MYFGTIAAPTKADAFFELMLAIAKRVKAEPPPTGCTKVYFPVGLLFARGDRAGDGKKISEQVVASFPYWNRDSGDSIDIVLAGWRKEQEHLEFNVDDFLEFRRLIEGASKWRYSGETDLLLLNFEVDLWAIDGIFHFSEVIILELEEMLRSKHISSVDACISNLIAAARKAPISRRFIGQSPIWEISDSIGVQKVKKEAWQAIKKLFLKEYADKFDSIANYAVRNIQSDLLVPIKLPFERMREVRHVAENSRGEA
jgi:hypothetical protein